MIFSDQIILTSTDVELKNKKKRVSDFFQLLSDFFPTFSDILYNHFLTNIDTLTKKDRQNGKETFENIIYNLTNHVGITFQRYINGDRKKIRFFVNNIECDAYDPFFKSKSTSSPQEYIKDKNLSCLVESFTLPSKEKCTEEEWNLYAGKEGYLANQGFYLYRNCYLEGNTLTNFLFFPF